MGKILIIYATVDGHAKKIAYFAKNILEKQNKNIDIFNVDDFFGELEKYKKILIISSIRYGKFHNNIRKFLEKNYNILNSKKSFFISINLVARKENKNTAQTNIYTKKFLEKTPFKPKDVGVFGGVLDYSKYGFFDKIMIKFIMKLTGGPTNTKSGPIEYTSWEKLEKFIKKFEKN